MLVSHTWLSSEIDLDLKIHFCLTQPVFLLSTRENLKNFLETERAFRFWYTQYLKYKNAFHSVSSFQCDLTELLCVCRRSKFDPKHERRYDRMWMIRYHASAVDEGSWLACPASGGTDNHQEPSERANPHEPSYWSSFQVNPSTTEGFHCSLDLWSQPPTASTTLLHLLLLLLL